MNARRNPARGLPPHLGPRAIDPGPRYWFAMLAASAFGTNVGDFVPRLLQGREASFAVLVVISCGAILADRRLSARTEAAYWVAIITLRAAATNLADYLTHDLAVGYAIGSTALFALTLIAARLTTTDPARNGAPRIDGRYWLAMLIAGFFGTVAGDYLAGAAGLYWCSTLFTALLFALIAGRRMLAPASVLLYWCIIMAERCAGTGLGDMLASRRALAFGLPLAMACTGAVMVAALLVRRMGGGEAASSVRPTAPPAPS